MSEKSETTIAWSAAVHQVALACGPNDAGEKLLELVETHRVIDLAKRISEMTGVKWRSVPNPRNEADVNELSVTNESLLSLGLVPT
jgi:UDP-sulfoquinovose synthase